MVGAVAADQEPEVVAADLGAHRLGRLAGAHVRLDAHEVDGRLR